MQWLVWMLSKRKADTLYCLLVEFKRLCTQLSQYNKTYDQFSGIDSRPDMPRQHPSKHLISKCRSQSFMQVAYITTHVHYQVLCNVHRSLYFDHSFRELVVCKFSLTTSDAGLNVSYILHFKLPMQLLAGCNTDMRKPSLP